MSVTTTTAVKNARLDAISTTWGASPKLRLYSGTMPTNAATALSGNNLLVEVTIAPAAASNGTKDMLGGAKSGTGTAAAGTGTTATFYRVYDSSGTTCHEQGTVGNTGSPDMTIDNPNIAQNQTVNLNSFTKTEP
jgi:hypothetical protein